MWFLTDITIMKYGYSELHLMKLCAKNNIKIRYAFHENKLMGKTISDNDYDTLIPLLNNKTNDTTSKNQKK